MDLKEAPRRSNLIIDKNILTSDVKIKIIFTRRRNWIIFLDRPLEIPCFMATESTDALLTPVINDTEQIMNAPFTCTLTSGYLTSNVILPHKGIPHFLFVPHFSGRRYRLVRNMRNWNGTNGLRIAQKSKPVCCHIRLY